MPQGFDWCPYFDFVELINKEKINLEEYPIYYYTENQFKINKSNNYKLSRVCLNRYGDVYSDNGNLQYSNDVGRVVLMRCKE